jgi:hypothetical protein
MIESDAAFLEALESGQIANSSFKHRDHLRAAWLYVKRDGPENAVHSMERTIKDFAARHGHERKFHLTLTVAWVKLVGAHVAWHDRATFDEFISLNERLLDKDLPLLFYSREKLYSELARSQWIDPDLCVLPEAE